MDTVVLTTLLFNTAGIVVTALVMSLPYCLPNRRRPRAWVRDADAVAPPAAAAVQPQVQAELLHAA